ncbi:HNH endonuclease, partial [bacterium]|nr:HNH endonuclease [bacterium]
MKERPEPNQKIDVSHSQNVITIQAGRDVHYHEAERPLNNEEGTRKAPHKEPELRRNKMKRETIPQKIKDKLLVEAMHRCCLCPQHEDITETHHIWPISEKGPNTEDNLMVVCPTCHAKIHRRPRMYTVKQLKEYKERWVSRCAQGIPIEMLIPSLHHQTEPEPNFVGRVEMLSTITGWYNDPSVHIGALIGWGGVGKSALVRRWYDTLTEDNIQPDGIFWWGFYGNAYLERFLEELLEYLAQGRIDVKEIKEAWQRVEKIKEFIAKGEYLIILDGLEEMQKGEEKGAEFGCLKHREFIDLLKFIADVNIRGLCLITTRYPLKDIENYRALTYQNIEVEQLGLDDARALFRKFGVRGEQDEIDKVINEYDGHALSLTLLCGHIVEKFDGDIKKAGEIPSFHSDKEAGGKAHRILLWYKSQLNEEQLAFLKIFSIFRKQVTEKDFEGVFRSKMGHCLVDMSIFSFMGIVDNLCKRRLITKGQDTYTTHPLIKNYFESIFNEEDKRLCHKHIYQYIGSYAPEKPNTLEEMQPLFEQVYHGCSARLYDEVYKLYDEKICRKEEYFLQDKLSALETNLSLVKTFFPKGDLSQMPLVSKKSAQSWLLNEAGLTLLSTGRPKEAEELFIRKTNMQIEDKDWKNASVGYRNLTELQFRIGEIEKALLSAKKALELSEKAKFDQFIVYSKSYLAWILHLLGKTKEAEKGFREADELEA